MRRPRPALPALVATLALATLGACIATAPEGLRRQTDQGGAGGLDLGGGSGGGPTFDAGTSDPYAVLGVDPPHGPFTGGQQALVRGKGLGADVRVFFGEVEVDPESMVLVDSTRVQVQTPPGAAGPVDVSIQNGDDASTRRSLAAAYSYDALYLVPAEGPTSGGTRIDLVSDAPLFEASSVVLVDQKPCLELEITSPTSASCTTPPGALGSKSVRVSNGDDELLVLDAFTYEDSDNGYKGGLSGEPLEGSLRVLVYNNFTGEPIPGAAVIVGTDLGEALVAQADATGLVTFDDASLVGARTVTVAATCHSPITFVDVPVDTVTAYLDPVLAPVCASSGDPPPTGGKPGATGLVTGELVWDSAQELQKGVWTNLPAAIGPNERRAAYVFTAATSPETGFTLPAETLAVTEQSPGTVGYGFVLSTGPGNKALYAVAGIENRAVSPPVFIPYVMGVVEGVSILPGSTTAEVYIPMRKTLDQLLTVDASPPIPGPKGPDRLRAGAAVALGNYGFALLPGLQETVLLPWGGALSVGGVPGLDGELAGASYTVWARASTGVTGTAPLSVVGRKKASSTSYPVTLDDFVAIPTVHEPAINTAWDGRHVEVSFAGGAPVDLTVLDVVSGNGLIRWTVAVPAGVTSVELPDLSALSLLEPPMLEHGALPPGPVTLGVYGARIDAFDYGALRYRHLRPQGMTAYSFDTFPTHL